MTRASSDWGLHTSLHKTDEHDVWRNLRRVSLIASNCLFGHNLYIEAKPSFGAMYRCRYLSRVSRRRPVQVPIPDSKQRLWRWWGPETHYTRIKLHLHENRDGTLVVEFGGCTLPEKVCLWQWREFWEMTLLPLRCARDSVTYFSLHEIPVDKICTGSLWEDVNAGTLAYPADYGIQ